MSGKLNIFIIRWLLNSIGLWLSVSLFGTGYESIDMTVSTFGFLFAGLIFSILNSILKPFIVILSLPAILVTLGLFMIIVNGLMVYISLRLVPGISMKFFESILTGMLLSLVNYIVSATIVVANDRSKQG